MKKKKTIVIPYPKLDGPALSWMDDMYLPILSEGYKGIVKSMIPPPPKWMPTEDQIRIHLREYLAEEEHVMDFYMDEDDHLPIFTGKIRYLMPSWENIYPQLPKRKQRREHFYAPIKSKRINILNGYVHSFAKTLDGRRKVFNKRIIYIHFTCEPTIMMASGRPAIVSRFIIC